MRTQKYYKTEIIKRFMPEASYRQMIEEYLEVRNYPRINNRVLQGSILKKVIENFDEFKEDYEAAKSPTVNNLPRNKYKKTVQRQPKVWFEDDKINKQKPDGIKYTLQQIVKYKFFGITVLEKWVYDKR